jgi:hypothetical protein
MRFFWLCGVSWPFSSAQPPSSCVVAPELSAAQPSLLRVEHVEPVRGERVQVEPQHVVLVLWLPCVWAVSLWPLSLWPQQKARQFRHQCS